MHLLGVQRLVAEVCQEGLPGFYALVRKDLRDYYWQDTTSAQPSAPRSMCATLRKVLNMLATSRHAMMDRAQNMCVGPGSCATDRGRQRVPRQVAFARLGVTSLRSLGVQIRVRVRD